MAFPRFSRRWLLAVLLLIAAIVVGIVGVYAVWQFALATGLRPLFYWGAGGGFCLVVLAVTVLPVRSSTVTPRAGAATVCV